jgi:SAM-dependent methyltransferase
VLQVGPEATVIARYGGNARSWLSVDLDPAHPLADRVMDVMDLDLEARSFDLVLCAHVIDLVDDKEKALRELHRVTRAALREQAQLRAQSVQRHHSVKGTGGDAVVAEDENVTARHERAAYRRPAAAQAVTQANAP